jgi:hypothetical protein
MKPFTNKPLCCIIVYGKATEGLVQQAFGKKAGSVLK